MKLSSLIKGRTTRPLKPALRCLHVALEELSHVSGVISARAWKLQVHLKQSSTLSLKEGGECVIRKHDGLMSGDFAVCCRVWCDKKIRYFGWEVGTLCIVCSDKTDVLNHRRDLFITLTKCTITALSQEMLSFNRNLPPTFFTGDSLTGEVFTIKLFSIKECFIFHNKAHQSG